MGLSASKKDGAETQHVHFKEENIETTKIYDLPLDDAQVKEQMSICVKSLSDDIWTLFVNESDTIDLVHLQLQDIAGIPVDRQQFIFEGKQLLCDWRLSDCKIGAGSRLHVISR